jgi:cold shock protein
MHATSTKRGGTSGPRGTVKFFDASKGFGFVERAGGDDLFVHHSSIVGEGFRTLDVGQQVMFEIGVGRKGEEARNVRVL